MFFENIEVPTGPSPLQTRGSSVLTSVAVVILGYVGYKLVSLLLYIRRLNIIFKDTPGPESKHWLYGSMHNLPKTSEGRILYGLSLCCKHPKYYVWWMGPAKASITVSHPSTVRKVMKTSEPKPTGFLGLYRMFLPWLGEGLLISSGNRWARSRRLLTSAFHFDVLRPYIGVYNDTVEVLLDKLDKIADTDTTFEVFEMISPCTLDIILKCAFSYRTDCQIEGESHPYVKAVHEITDLITERVLRPYLYWDLLYYLTPNGRRFKRLCDYVHSEAENVIRERRNTLEKSLPSTRKYLDFMDILLTAKDEAGVGMTPIEIRNEVDTFLFEGHDTTASGISWILYALATHPEHQRRCQEEIDDLLQGRQSDRIEWNDLSKLEFLTMCIKEGMRLYSPVPFIQREFTHDFELEGRTFPKGTSVSLHVFGLHHNTNVWEKPMEFIPERFSQENVAKMDPYQFVPFSAGPRNCIGQNFAMNEEKVVLSRLLRKFTFEADASHEVHLKVSAVMRAENGIKLYARRR